jgi:hypothetical protein
VMPRPRPPHLQREITRHGKPVWYVRIDRGPRVRIKAEFGTPEFDAEYRAAVAGAPIRKSSPSSAMRGLFRWAHNAKLVKVDPTSGVSNPKRKGTDGFVPWSEADMAAYEARWPIGTRQRVWLT